jgi:hypothetical protein
MGIMGSLDNIDEYKEGLASRFAEIDTQTQEQTNEIVQNALDQLQELDASGEMATAGANTIQGYINGLDSKSGALFSRISAIMQTSLNTAKTTLGIHSPSKEMKKVGQYTIAGYILGIDSYEDKMKDVMEGVSEMVLAAFDTDEAKEQAEAFMEWYQDYIDDIVSETQDALDEITDKLEDVYDLQDDMFEKLSDYGDLVNEVKITWSDGTTTSYSELSNLDEQTEAILNYGASLDALKDKQVPDDLLSAILDMDIDDAQEYMDMLNGLSDEEFAKYIESWNRKQAAAKEVAEKYYQDEVDALNTEYAEKLSEGMDKLYDVTYGAGEQTVLSLIDGMKAHEAEVKAEAQAIADIVSSAMNMSISGMTADVSSNATTSGGATTSAQTAAAVNAAMMAAGTGTNATTTVNLVLSDGSAIANWLINDIRNADAANPTTVKDY